MRTFALLICFASLALPPSLQATTIEEAVSQALERHESGRAADARAQAAAARVGRARSLLLPSLRAEGVWTRHGDAVSNRDEGAEGRLSASQTLFSARAFPMLAAALSTREAARLEAAETRRGIAFATAGAFLDALATQELAAAASRRHQLARQAEDEIRVRFAAQLTGSNELSRAELESATAEGEWVRAQGTARVARLALEHWMGNPLQDSLTPPVNLLAEAREEVSALDATQATANRQDLLAMRARLKALRQTAVEPLMRWVPDLSLGASSTMAEGEGVDGARTNWLMNLTLGWPLYDGGMREADRAEQKALARAAELDLTVLERGLRLELESAQALLESARAALVRSRVALDAARRNAHESAELYRRGLARALDVVDANVRLFEAEAEQVRSQAELASAHLGLRQAQGLSPFHKESSR